MRGVLAEDAWMPALGHGTALECLTGTYRPALHADAVALLTPHAATIVESLTVASPARMGSNALASAQQALLTLPWGNLRHRTVPSRSYTEGTAPSQAQGAG